MLRLPVVSVMAAAIVAFAPLPSFSQPGTGRLKAIVGDEGGKPVRQAVVVYSRIPVGQRDPRGRFHEAPGQVPISSQASVDAAGAFITPQVPAGNYTLCIKAAGYLTSCNWSGWLTTAISSGQDHDFGRIVLKKAVAVTIRINDPLHLLPRDPNSLGISAGVIDDDHVYHGPDSTDADSNGRTLQVGVPLGRAMQLWLHSIRFRLATGDGAIVNSTGTKIPFRANEGGLPPTFVVNVSGAK